MHVKRWFLSYWKSYGRFVVFPNILLMHASLENVWKDMTEFRVAYLKHRFCHFIGSSYSLFPYTATVQNAFIRANPFGLYSHTICFAPKLFRSAGMQIFVCVSWQQRFRHWKLPVTVWKSPQADDSSSLSSTDEELVVRERGRVLPPACSFRCQWDIFVQCCAPREEEEELVSLLTGWWLHGTVICV